MGFFDRGKAPAAKAASTPTKGNKGEGDPVNGYPFGSTTPGYIDYRDVGANGDFFPGTRRQMYRDDPNARKRHTPGSDRYHQVEDWIADGNPTGRDNLGGGSRGGTSRTSSGSSGNRGEGDPVNGYPFGSTTPGYIDYRDIGANGDFFPGTRRQMYRDDPNSRKRHTPGSDRRSQMDRWIADGNPTGRDNLDAPWPGDSRSGSGSGGGGGINRGLALIRRPSGGSGNDAANRPSSGRELNEWLRDHPSGDSLPGWAVDPGFSKSPRMGGGRGGMIEGYLGSGGATEDLPPGASFDMPSSNILSALKPLSDNLWNGNKPTGSGTASPAKKPTVVRRGGGRTDAR